MPTFLTSGRPRLATVALAALFAVVLGGADGCSSDPNVEGARLYIRNNDLPAAVTALDRALEANPDNATAVALRAEVRRRQADAATDPAERQALIDQMATDLQRATTLAPDDADVRVTRINGWVLTVTKGNAALTNQDVDPAVSQRLFQSAVTILPDSSQGHFGLGLAFLRADDAPAAVPHLRRASEIDDSRPAPYIYLARALLLSEQGAEAIGVLEEAGERFPEDADIRATLLNAYASAGRTDEALASYERAVAAAPDDALIRYNYGALLLRAERYDDAVEQLERATALAPDNGDAQYNLGAAFQNKAAALTSQANAATDDAEANALIAQRDELLNRSLTNLLRARELAGGNPDSERAACNALFQVYSQLGRLDDASSVATCAGIDLN